MLLPTTEWTDACETVATQLGPGDTLLVICDRPDDPVAAHDPPAGVEVVVAGEPSGCSGKANALACGMERAATDRVVWTDDDFRRGSDWLEELIAAGERHGPATAVPVFTGGGWWRLLEPYFGVLFALCFAARVGGLADAVWGGGVTFTRSELAVDVPTFAAELRGVLSDDLLLSRRLDDVHVVRSQVMAVEVPGDARSVWHRSVRFARIGRVAGAGYPVLVVTVLVALAAAVYTPVAAPLVTLLAAAGYRHLGVDRASFLLAFPGLFLLPALSAVGLGVASFEWGGRRYRYAGEGDVEVVEERRSR